MKKVHLKQGKNKIMMYAFDPAKGKMVHTGDIVNQTYRKVGNQKTFMRVLSGWGIQKEVFDELAHHEVKYIEIKDMDNHVVWITDYTTYKEHSKVADYGNGKQVFLSLKYYELRAKKTKQPEKLSVFDALAKSKPEQIERMQKTLFDS